MKHIKIEIVANDYQQEELIALFDDYSATGFEQTDEKLMAYFVEDGFVQEEILKMVEGYKYTISEIEETNWNAEWERNFHPVIVDNFCAVRAHFHAPITTTKHEIIITPKMSFGTGHHATTYMMMDQMSKLDFSNKSVFDFGTGTGILAILAEKLGASTISAIDIDEWSIENAKENMERNNCTKIEVRLSTTIPLQQFDIILANINRNVILKNLSHLKNALKRGGVLLLSGLLVSDEKDILDACLENNLHFQNSKERSGWLSFLLVNAL